jgi:predicted TIM-barrel fold metal-dependent hydrolase
MTTITASGGTGQSGELDRYIVISSDTHAGPPLKEYRSHIQSKYHEAFDEYRAEREAHLHRHERSMLEVFRETLDMPEDAVKAFASHPTLQPGGAPGLWDAECRMRDLDTEGISGEIIFPDFTAANDPPFSALGGGRKRGDGRFGAAATEFYAPELVREGCRAWNEWLAEFCAASPERRAGMAVIPIHDVDAAVEEVAWAREAGLRGGIFLPGQVHGLPGYNDPGYERIWAACEDYGMPLNCHVGNDLPDYGVRPEAFAISQTEMLFFGHRALWFLMWSGVFERHPNLVFALTEQDCYWVPQTLKELETQFDSKFAGPGLRKRLSLRPSEYWLRQCFVGATVMSRAEAERRHEIGLKNIMWGSDYPHIESSWPHTPLVLRHTFHDLPVDEVRLIVGENAARAYGFDLKELAAVAARIGPRVNELVPPLPEVERPRGYIGEGFREPLSHT